MDPRSLLQAIVRRLDRGGSPDRNFPDRDGEYWALCPFHPDRHPNNFSVSEAGYHCFACSASGGLWPLAEKLGGFPVETRPELAEPPEVRSACTRARVPLRRQRMIAPVWNRANAHSGRVRLRVQAPGLPIWELPSCASELDFPGSRSTGRRLGGVKRRVVIDFPLPDP